MTNLVTAEEVSRACESLRRAGVDPKQATRVQISQVCGMFERRARTVREWIQRGSIDVQTTPLIESPEELKPTTFEEALAAYRNWIGLEVLVRTKRSSVAPRREKIIAAGDFHVPFHNMDAVSALIEEESSDTDTLVLNGDLGDFWGTSRYPKSKRLVTPCEELAQAQAILTLLAQHFKRIKVVGGNHDERPAKFLTQSLPPEVLDYIRMTGPMAFEPLRFMAAGLDNVEIAESTRSDHADFGFFYQHGDLVCTHAERYSTIPNKATGDVNKWIHSFAIPQGLIRGPVRCIVQAHTHQGGSVLGDYGVLCIEGGCLSGLQDYHGGARIMTPRPLAPGWSVIYQNNGVTDRRESRFKPFKG